MMSFTVIIPTKNREGFLQIAVASVLKQQNVSFELLVVNDGEPLQHHFDDPRIHILDNAKRGAVYARNLAIANARGNSIAFLDDDDYWIDPQHLAQAEAQFKLGHEFYFADGVLSFPDGSKKPFCETANLASLRQDNTILISAVCYRTALHTALGNFDEALPYYWDWDWYLRVAAAKYTLFHQPKTCVNIVVHAQNMSGGNNIELRRANLNGLSAKHGLGHIALKNHTDFV